MTSRTNLARRATAALAILAFTAAACGGDDDAGGEPAPDTADDTADDTTGSDATDETDSTEDTESAGSTEDTEATGSDAPADSGQTGEVFTIAARVDNRSFDPADLGLGHFVQYWMPVYDTLLVLAPDGTIEPNMASEWSYNDDKTVLTLNLQEGITFTDGEVFDAEAVKANIEYLRDSGGQFSTQVASVTDVVVVDDLTVELHLNQPDPALLFGLAVVGGAMASPAALGDESLATTPVGSGAYTLDEGATTPGTEYVFVRNPDYWNPDAYAYDSIVVKPITDNQARLNAVQSGQADTALLGTPNNVEAAEEAGLRVDTTPVNWHGLVIADRAGEVVPALGDPRVRQAINMAFDKDAIVESVMLGYAEPTSQVFGVNNDAYDPDLADAYSFDVERAKELLAEAGYANGFEVTMAELSGFSQINPIIAAQLSQIGITVNYEPVPPDSTIPSLLSGEFPMYFFSLGSQSAGEDFQKLLVPNGAWNTSKYDDPEVVALIDEYAAASDDEQVAAAQAVNQYVVDNAWFAPIYYEQTLLATNPDVGFTPHSMYVVPFPRDYYVAS